MIINCDRFTHTLSLDVGGITPVSLGGTTYTPLQHIYYIQSVIFNLKCNLNLGTQTDKENC